MPEEPRAGGGSVKIVTANFAAGASISSSVDCSINTVVYILIPPDWTSACLSMLLSADNQNFYDFTDNLGNELTYNVTAGTAVLVERLIGNTYIKFRSGSSGAPVPQQNATAIIGVIQ